MPKYHVERNAIEPNLDPEDAPVCDQCSEEYDGDENDNGGLCPKCVEEGVAKEDKQ